MLKDLGRVEIEHAVVVVVVIVDDGTGIDDGIGRQPSGRIIRRRLVAFARLCAGTPQSSQSLA